MVRIATYAPLRAAHGTLGLSFRAWNVHFRTPLGRTGSRGGRLRFVADLGEQLRRAATRLSAEHPGGQSTAVDCP